jgi:hypothetical protein
MYIVEPPIQAGDRPGRGTWRCLRCNWRVEIPDHATPLPPCDGECKKDPETDAAKAHFKRVRGIT